MKDVLQKQEDTEVKERVLPKHIAIIMDGNRRWAKNKKIPTMLGHREGVQTLKKITRYASDIGIKYLTVYAFSTENWSRKKEEVDFLMYLVGEVLQNELEELNKNNVKITFIGNYTELPQPVPKEVEKAIENTKNNTGLKLQVALNYGSRAEIIHAVQEIGKKIINKEIKPEDIDDELISQHLYTKGIPDPCLLIRTGGEQRISNYLLWQCAYTEFYSTEALWPDFSIKEFEKAIDEFNTRQRRFGT